MFRHRNIVLRFQRILLTWLIPFLYSLLKTFSSLVLTSKSLIWVEMITLGLFWTENEIFVWIWSKTLSLHFGKSKVPIFLSKCYIALIFAQHWPYGHRKYSNSNKTKCWKCFHRNIVLRFRRILLTWFIQFLYSLFKKISSHVLTSKSLISVQINTLSLFWTQNEVFVWIRSIRLSLHFAKPKVPSLVPKCYTAYIFTPKGPYRHRNDCIWTKT